MNDDGPCLTELTVLASEGDEAALDSLMSQVYPEVRAAASRALQAERVGHTLQPTAIVHEVYLRLIRNPPTNWIQRSHFIALCSRLVRQILRDHARDRNRQKREGGRRRITLHGELCEEVSRALDTLDLEEALSELERDHPRIAELLTLRFYGGSSVEECANHLAISRSTAYEWLDFAIASLKRSMHRGYSE